MREKILVRLAEYNQSIEKLAKRLIMVSDYRSPESKSGYDSCRERQIVSAFVEDGNSRHISKRLKEESDRDVAQHKGGYPHPPAGHYSTPRIK